MVSDPSLANIEVVPAGDFHHLLPLGLLGLDQIALHPELLLRLLDEVLAVGPGGHFWRGLGT